jgi:hypothetical protein
MMAIVHTGYRFIYILRSCIIFPYYAALHTGYVFIICLVPTRTAVASKKQPCRVGGVYGTDQPYNQQKIKFNDKWIGSILKNKPSRSIEKVGFTSSTDPTGLNKVLGYFSESE